MSLFWQETIAAASVLTVLASAVFFYIAFGG